MRTQSTLKAPAAALLLAGGALLASTAVQQASAHDKHDKEGKAEVEGTVSELSGSCPDITFKIAETRVVTKEKTKYDDGTCNDVANGATVEVKGKLSEDGTMSAWKIDLDE